MSFSLRTALRFLAILTLISATFFTVIPQQSVNAHQRSTCHQHWGSLAKNSSVYRTGPLREIRTGRHVCYDRIVFETSGKPTGYSVRYVKNVHQDGSGAVVPVAGGAKIQITLHNPSYNKKGQATFRKADLPNVNDYKTFRDLKWAGSFEGSTTVGLGVRARLPFRVFTLSGPDKHSRLVVDVAHKW